MISISTAGLCTALCAAVLAWPPAAYAADGGSPTGPSDLRITSVGYDSVSLTWEPSAGRVAYYQILRNGRWVNSSYGTTGTVRYLAAGSTYILEVRARDVYGNVSAPVEVMATTRADAGPPTTPSGLRVVVDARGAPSGLSWDASADDRAVGGYWLFADGDMVFGGGQQVDFFTLTDVECTLVSGETHTFTVRARDVTGNMSASSSTVTVTVP